MQGLKVFCSSAGENNHLSSCERKSQRAVRRRMEIRRFKVMAISVVEPGVAPPHAKRIKLVDSKFSDVVARDCFNVVNSNSSALILEVREIQVETISSKSEDEGFVLKENVTTGHANEALQACSRSFSRDEFQCLEYGDECLVLASDELWDLVSNDVVCELARKCLSIQFPGGGTHTRTLSKDGNVEESRSTAAAALLTKLALGTSTTSA